MKTLILALGNPILSDDGVGHEVADRLAERLPSTNCYFGAECNNRTVSTISAGSCPQPNMQYDIIKSSAATMDIIPKLAGYDRLAVIDAVQLGSAPPGTVHRFSITDLASTIRRSSPHDVNFATALQMGKEWGYRIPTDIRIYGIEVIELLRFSENCTAEVAAKLDEIVEQILSGLIE